MKKLVLFVAVAIAVSFASCKKPVQDVVPQEVEATVDAAEEGEEAVVVEGEEVAPAVEEVVAE